jgi:hypothetical protein
MTQLLEKAMIEVQRLPECEQDAIATLILDEIADERLWDEAFARSQEQLGRLAEKVREDIRAGRWACGKATPSPGSGSARTPTTTG